MRIGFVSQTLPYLPARDGFRVYGANLIRALSKEHEVDLVSLARPEDADMGSWARRYCRRVRLLQLSRGSPWARAANFASAFIAGKQLARRRDLNEIIRQSAASGSWTVMHVEGGLAGALIDGLPPVPSVLSVHDAEGLRAREMLKCSLRPKQRAWYTFLQHAQPRRDRLLFRRFDCTTVVAERDCAFLRKVVPGARFAVVPHGIDTDYYRPLAECKKPREMVFHGHLAYPPNVQAAVEFVHDILPLVRSRFPEASFRLVGAEPSREVRGLATLPGVKLSANLPDLREAVSGAQVYVCPVRYGSGLKNKVLEAMAMQVPIVAYHPGATHGIECVPGEHLLTAANPREFAGQIAKLFLSPVLADRVGKAARQLMLAKYSWESRARACERLYQAAIEKHQHAARTTAHPRAGVA